MAAPDAAHRHLHDGGLLSSLDHLARAWHTDAWVTALSREPGFLQRLDARCRLLLMALAAGTAVAAHRVGTLAALCLLAVLVAAASHVPLARFLSRVWLFVPLFTAALAWPALFNLVTPGRSLLSVSFVGPAPRLGAWQLPQTLALTAPGLRSFFRLVLRPGVCVSWTLLVVFTTPWPQLTRALHRLRAPSLAVAMLSMTHRYLFLLSRNAEALMLSRRSRQVGRLSAADQRRWLGMTMGALLGRSHHLGEQVSLAMISRGYRMDPPRPAPQPFARRDWAALAAGLLIAVAALALDRRPGR